jgi:hypothetical protein
MTFDVPTLWGKFRVRLKTVAAALVIIIPAVLDQLGIVDLKPILIQLFGEQKGTVYAGVASAIFFVLRLVTSGPVIEKLPDDKKG